MARPEQIAERFDKLPKWAQRYIVDLEGKYERLARDLHQIETGTTKVTYTRGQEGPFSIPDHVAITFNLASGSIDARLMDGKLRVYADNRLLIEPAAANAAILVDDRS